MKKAKTIFGRRIHFARRGGFTLVELLTVIAVVAILASLLLSVLGEARAKTRAVSCQNTMRQLGVAFHLYANDHDGEIPPSWHSAAIRRTGNWAVEISPYLHPHGAASSDAWSETFNRYFRCSEDDSWDPMIFSYGLNVYFELDPASDSYEGSPETWRRIEDLNQPSSTILLAETRPVAFGDHFMCHQWGGIPAARNAVNHDRHGEQSNYLFADGNVRRLDVSETFDPQKEVNRWHPAR